MEIFSVIIATIALIVSVYSVYESRKNIQLSQEPHIVAHEKESETEFSYEITNKGGGPAFFKKVEYFLNLEPLKDKTIREALREVLTAHGVRFKSSIMKLGDETIMAPGETFVLASIVIHKDDIEKMKNIPNAIVGIRVIYRSAHGKEKIWRNDERIKNI